MPSVDGVRFATGAAGIRYKGRTDVMLALFDKGTQVAGVFTTSKCPSAPVDWCRARLAQGKARARCSSIPAMPTPSRARRAPMRRPSRRGSRPRRSACRRSRSSCPSTGVIGEPLDAKKFEGVLDVLVAAAAPDGIHEAAKAIMTTDTFPKLASAVAQIDGVAVTITGIAKGSGMIAPDMATMLAYVFTDAPIAAPALQAMLSKGVKTSFNAITVDSDTSTSDTLMLFATGAAAARGVPKIATAADRRLKGFKAALAAVLLELAHQVVKDGEGARKFIEVAVEGAASDKAAHRIALSIANSPLVKTAVAGEDANWGRVVMAVGKAGEKADRDKLAIWFGGTRVAHKGLRDPAYDEDQVSELMRKPHVPIKVDLGLGKGRATVWTCDLTKEYIAINGDYRS